MTFVKRSRPDEDDDERDPTLITIQRSETIWLHDGNVILQAENRQFRVHQSVLSMRSKVFEDMFQLPQPAGQKLVEECPVVDVFDKSDGWEILLKLLYIDLDAFISLSQLPVARLLEVTRICHKYAFNQVAEIALQVLRDNFPTTIDNWDYVVSKGRIHSDKVTSVIKHFMETQDNEIDIINLALDLKIQTILPLAYYTFICNHKVGVIIGGIKRSDGTVARLSPASQRALLIGRESFVSLKKPMASSLVCRNPAACQLERYQILRLKLSLLHRIKALFPPSLCYDDVLNGLCENCKNSLNDSHVEQRRLVWEKIPQCFELPNWEDLKDFNVGE